MQAYLDHITNCLLTQSWQIVLLVLAVGAVSFLLKNKSAHIRYLLWLVVLAKCLVPPLFTLPLPVLPQNTVHEIMLTPSGIMSARSMETTFVSESKPISAPSVAVVVPPIEPTRFTFQQWLAFVWVGGVAVYSLLALIKALRTNRWLRRQRRVLPDELEGWVKSLFSALDLRTFPKLWLIDSIGQPFVWGLLRGSIYLPTDFVKIEDPEHRRGILGHEISHMVRYDAAVNCLQVMAQAIFWFHPFVWWANKRIRAEREKCCDEMVIALLKAKVKDYSIAIVNILVTEHESTRPVPSLAVAGPVKNIEERIKTMLRPGKEFYKRPSLVALVVVLLIALLTVPAALVLTARAESKSATEGGDKPTKTLHEAAAAGDIEQVKLLISKGADVDAKDKLGRTALHCASEKGHAEVAKLLISQGADVNAMDRNLAKPLHYAVMRGEKQTVELLLSKGADINAKNRDGRTPLFEAMKSSAAGRKEVVELLASKGAKVPALHLAAYMGDIEKVRKCLQDGIDINSQENFCCTALHAAANSGKKDIVEFLISKGAMVDAKDALGVTPLYYAAMHNYEDIADLLLAKGADVNAKAKRGCTLLYYAIWDNSKDAIKLLISKGANVNVKHDGYTPIVYAIWENDKDMVELLISKGADVNTKDKDGVTPYYWAAMQGSKDLVELLTAKGATVESTIHLAARTGDLAKVKRFIEEGTDVNVKDKVGQTPLFSAVLADNNDVVKFLIAKGADVNAKNGIGATPLNFVMMSSGKVELLISKGADVNTKDKKGATPLHRACLRGQGQKDVVELLIAKGSNVNAKITDRSANGWTPLYFACSAGAKGLAELLIAKGADINIKDNNGQTPLHLACLRGHKDVVELLIAKGADMNAKDNKQQTALSLAKEQGHEEIVELLRKHGAIEQAPVISVHELSLHEAAVAGDIEQVKLHISKGTNVNEKTATGDTPLHHAVIYGHEDVAKLLIANGANVNERTTDGDTPLHYAARYGQKNVAELLITKGADVNAKNKNGDLPTHLALRGNLESPKKEVLELLIAKGTNLSCIQISAHQGDLAKVRSFVEQGISVDSRDSEGRTALHYAAMQGKADVVEFLLSRGADVNAKDKDFGFIPLHHAASGGHKDVVEMLLAKGADVNAKDKYGWTPLDSAVYGQKDVAELLIRAGANVNSKYEWGQTPLMWAATEGYTPMAELLIAKGADINARENNSRTPLHLACLEGNKDVVELLIAKGADMNTKDNKEQTALSLAKEQGHEEIVELLSKHGAKE